VPVVGVAALLAACTSTSPGTSDGSSPSTSSSTTSRPALPASSRAAGTSEASRPPGEFTIAFAGDVHFSGRVDDRLTADPATVFGPAAAVLRRADLTMVNLETAITTGGSPAPKQFHFRAPATAFTALRDAGIDVATMANNHGADYGSVGLHDTLAAITASHFPVVGIGKNATAAFAPYETTINGQKVAILAASQVEDETLARYSAGPSTPGIASAYSSRLIDGVKAARAAGYLVIVYLHWGIEYTKCPDSAQEDLASALDTAGATAVIGTHVHEFQGAGWKKDGTYVAYGLGNYLWWMSFGNIQDDNGVLTLTFRDGKVTNSVLSPSHLDSRGVPVPATGAEAARIIDEFNGDRGCTGLAAAPPR
jgi:poly-gamma-glutamate synthesis protein (capsule biosynthesis protein)